MIAPAQLIDVLFVIVPHALLLDIAGPADAFRLANQHRERQGLLPRFRLRFAASTEMQSSSVGLSIAGLEPLPDELRAITWVVLVGQPSEQLDVVTPAITITARWLNRLLARSMRENARGHRLVTVCSGALLAARAGLLTGRSCTTHHEVVDTLRTLAPHAKVIDNRVFVVDGPIASSAGITAGIDLALQLIAEECGESLAASVAEDMVVYFRRSDRDPEQSPFRAHRGHLHATVHRVQDAIVSEPRRDWNMAELARAGHTTERHLLRLFSEHARVSPLQYLQAIRLERAKRALEHGSSVTQAAEVAGFRSDLQMRRAWRRHWGGSPRDALKTDHGAAAFTSTTLSAPWRSISLR